jgi:predicted N-acetyltransferase YhbS
MLIRAEGPEDRAAVRAVNLSAFETPVEADLVDALREQVQPLVSLVAEDEGAVVVLGHPAYYPRFGFSPSTRFGIECEYDAPADAFMVLELHAGFLRGASGTVRYHTAFGEAG